MTFNYQQNRRCTHPAARVFKVNQVQFWAASTQDLALMDYCIPDAVILNCSGSAVNSDYRVKQIPARFKELNKYAMEWPPEIVLDWADFGPAPVTVEFWKGFLTLMRKEKIHDVLVCCTGSHGRTGTALAAFLLAGGQCKDAFIAIEKVRQRHCIEAVESSRQVAYLILVAKHLGLMTDEDWTELLIQEAVGFTPPLVNSVMTTAEQIVYDYPDTVGDETSD